MELSPQLMAPTGMRGVTFSELGTRGRLGNHLWQIAAVIGQSIDNRLPIRLPPWKFSAAFNPPASWFTPPTTEDTEVYDLVDYLRPKDKYVLQDLRLWWQHRDVVREFLSPAQHVLHAAHTVYEDALRRPNLASVHIRRGDYVKYSTVYPLPSIDYYQKAIEGIPKRDIIVFTDDPAWVIENMPFFKAAHLTRGPANFVDLACMTRCDRHIIANSSFSWWGAFLSRSTEVICPARWYTDAWASAVSPLIVPPTWTPIDNQ